MADGIKQTTQAEKFVSRIQAVPFTELPREIGAYLSNWSIFWGFTVNMNTPEGPRRQLGNDFPNLDIPARVNALGEGMGLPFALFTLWKTFIETVVERVVAQLGGFDQIDPVGEYGFLLKNKLCLRKDKDGKTIFVLPGVPDEFVAKAINLTQNVITPDGNIKVKQDEEGRTLPVRQYYWFAFDEKGFNKILGSEVE